MVIVDHLSGSLDLFITFVSARWSGQQGDKAGGQFLVKEQPYIFGKNFVRKFSIEQMWEQNTFYIRDDGLSEDTVSSKSLKKPQLLKNTFSVKLRLL